MRARPSLVVAGLLLLAGCAGAPDTVTGSGTTGPDPADAVTSTTASEAPSTPTGSTEAGSTGSRPPGSPTDPAPASSSAVAGPATSATELTSYTDARFGFTVRVPDGFSNAGAVDDRGMRFTGPGDVNLRTYGSDNLFQGSTEQVCQEQAEAYRTDGGSATMTFGDDECTITAKLQNTSYQLRTWVGSASLNHVEVSYPPTAATRGQETFTTAVAGFTPGDLESSH